MSQGSQSQAELATATTCLQDSAACWQLLVAQDHLYIRRSLKARQETFAGNRPVTISQALSPFAAYTVLAFDILPPVGQGFASLGEGKAMLLPGVLLRSLPGRLAHLPPQPLIGTQALQG